MRKGGTEFGHCVTVARAKEITGPYEVDPQNPMMSSKAAADYPIQRAGHGQLVDDGCGNWYISHLCSRPVNGYSILGRETAIQNIVWIEDGWYRLADGGMLPAQEFEVQGCKEACYYNYDNYYYLRVSHDEELGVCICVTTVENREVRESEYVAIPDAKGNYYLRAEVKYDKLYMSYSLDGEQFHAIGDELNMTIISDEHVSGNGFIGAMIGVCCQDLQGDGCYADFDWMEYNTEG